MLAGAARAAGASLDVEDAAHATATARHFFEVCVATGCTAPLHVLCAQAAAACRAHVDGALAVDVLMVDFDGDAVVARG